MRVWPNGGELLPLLHGSNGELVYAVVHLIVRMPFHLNPGYVVSVVFDDERFPEVSVFDRFLRRVLPAVSNPVANPVVVEGSGKVGAIGV